MREQRRYGQRSHGWVWQAHRRAPRPALGCGKRWRSVRLPPAGLMNHERWPAAFVPTSVAGGTARLRHTFSAPTIRKGILALIVTLTAGPRSPDNNWDLSQPPLAQEIRELERNW